MIEYIISRRYISQIENEKRLSNFTISFNAI